MCKNYILISNFNIFTVQNGVLDGCDVGNSNTHNPHSYLKTLNWKRFLYIKMLLEIYKYMRNMLLEKIFKLKIGSLSVSPKYYYCFTNKYVKKWVGINCIAFRSGQISSKTLLPYTTSFCLRSEEDIFVKILLPLICLKHLTKLKPSVDGILS